MLQPPGSVIEHCHVVHDLDAALDHWTKALGAGPFYVGEMHFPEGHTYRGEPSVMAIKVALGFSGGLLIELIEPMADDHSVFSEALEERGPGFHHVMLREDYDSGRKRFEAMGYTAALENTTPLGERCVLMDTRDATGGYVEFMDLHIGFERLTQMMADAHESWDGSQPVRPMASLFAALAHPA